MSGLDSYSSTVWDMIPMQGVAFKHVREYPLKESIFDRVRSVFLAHNVENLLALYINHRHFAMAADERLVEYNGVAPPWQTETPVMAPIRPRILPKTWAFVEGQICAYEFEFADSPNQRSADNLGFSDAFVNDFREVLQESNLQDIFGFTLLNGCSETHELVSKRSRGPRVEFTTGRSSVTIENSDEYPTDELIETTWVFGREGGSKPYTRCLQCCKLHGCS